MFAFEATHAAVFFKMSDLLIAETISISDHIKINAKIAFLICASMLLRANMFDTEPVGITLISALTV